MPATNAPVDHYAAIHQQFRWHVPAQFNMAQVCCRRWADNPDTMKNIAVRAHSMPATGQKRFEILTYEQLAVQANQLSHLLKKQGVQRGDRVAIVLPQRLETAVAYMAVLQMGAVAMPLSMLFGAEALEYRFNDSGAVVAIVDESSILAVRDARKSCPALRCVIGIGDAADHTDLDYALQTLMQPTQFPLVKTRSDEAAVLIYTSGTTGPPKGALIPHRALIGNLTGFVASQNWFGFDGRPNTQSFAKSDAVFWSPADWAWTGGLMDALLPTLYFGREIIAFNGRFSPQVAFEILQSHRVTHTFLFPTALKAMMKAYPEPKKKFKFKLQALMSAGEAVGDAVYDWCDQQLGVKVNEMFGQTEINYVVGNCNKFWPSKPGSMGKGYPGHQVAVINEASEVCNADELGEVAVNHLDVHGKPDPVFFLGYWNNEAATIKKTTVSQDGQRWCRTGDLAYADADGYLWYQGRADDMFKAAGYRIGPGEVENCLLKYPAVLNAAVVPKPDIERGAVVKAYIVLTPEFIALRAVYMPANDLKGLKKHDDELIERVQQHVRGLLAPYEYPKEIEFIDALPMTTTGKVQRRVLRLQEEERFRSLNA